MFKKFKVIDFQVWIKYLFCLSFKQIFLPEKHVFVCGLGRNNHTDKGIVFNLNNSTFKPDFHKGQVWRNQYFISYFHVIYIVISANRMLF